MAVTPEPAPFPDNLNYEKLLYTVVVNKLKWGGSYNVLNYGVYVGPAGNTTVLRDTDVLDNPAYAKYKLIMLSETAFDLVKVLTQVIKDRNMTF